MTNSIISGVSESGAKAMPGRLPPSAVRSNVYQGPSGPQQSGEPGPSGPRQAALRYQHATDERDRVLASGIDRLIRAAREEATAPVVYLRSAGGGSETVRR